MSKSVEQINALISKTVKSARTDRDLALKGLSFGRWLNNVGEYEKAAKWLVKYLAVSDKDAKAHRLLGEIYERLDNSDAALSCYKNSLRVKQQQFDLMLKVAEMHINPGPVQDPGRAEVWLDKAAAALPNNPQVYKLKMELYLAKEEPSSKLEDTILEELKKRPGDPSLHVQYVSFLKDQERLQEAFEYSQKTVHSVDLLKSVENDLEWNQCIIDTCQEYTERTCDDEVTPEGIKAHSLLMVSICRFVWLSFEQEKYDDAIENLAMLDTTVFSALSLNQEAGQGDAKTEWDAIINESKGQLYWLSGIALVHLATKDEISWSESTKLSAACFAASLSFPMADVAETWASWSKDSSFSKRLKVMGGFRLSQSAHMLYNLASVSHTAHREEDEFNERKWMKEVTDNFCTNEGRKKVFNELFGDNYNPETSMICSDDMLSQICVQHIPEESLNAYDTIAALRADLQVWIWMGLQWRQNFDNALDPFAWISTVFPDLQPSAGTSAKYGNAWNLNQLDVESFIVGCVLCAEKAASLWTNAKPDLEENALGLSRLPLPLCRKLTTEHQNDWWESACMLHCRKGKERIFNANQIRATLRRGVECIRGSGNHGLQVTLIAGLAKHFGAKAYAIDKSGMGTSSAAWSTYQRRAAQYWMIALPFLQDVAINRSKLKTQPTDRLFPCTLSEPTMQEANSMISEVYMCNGSLLVQEGDLRRALDTYGKADTPHASFCEALIYKQLLENCDKDESSILGSNGKKREAYMRKYTARLQITLNRLEREPDEELLRRTEELLHQHVSTSPSMVRTRDNDPKRLFEETIPKQSPLAGNRTVNSEVDETFAIPSKQSTPKGESRAPPSQDVPSDGTTMKELVKTLSTLVSTLSMMQIQMHEKTTKEEQERNPKPTTQRDPSSNEIVYSQLEKITSIVSGLQEKKDEENEEKRQMKSQIEAMKEQLAQTQLHTPTAPTRVVQLTQPDGIPLGSPLQAFDQYQQASLAQINNPMAPGSPYVGSPYHGYLPQNPAMAAMYAQRGYSVPQGLPPAYGQNRMPQQVIDHRVIPSPVRTPPLYVRPQTPSNSGLPISREAADALSVRFQASMTGNASPGQIAAQSSGMQPPPMPGARSLGPSVIQNSMMGMQGFDQTGMPVAVQGRLPHAQSEPVMGGGQGMFSNISLGHPQPPPLTQRPPLQQSLNESYLPPTATTLAQQSQGTSVLKSLLASDQNPTVQPAQPEIHYPEHINFPQPRDQQATTTSATWSFKFQAPEDIDRDNKKLEADEEAEDAEAAHNDTGPHFEPLVTLPEVEVRTGEEDEEAVFSERAKLYRWHEGQWKERGVGTMKILKHKENGKYRLLMRRDQILKICCNHLIGQSMDLQLMPKTDKAWIWHAMDFSEDEGKQECLAIRYKTTEIANQFREKFLEGKQANSTLSGGTPVKATSKPPVKDTSTPQTAMSVVPPTSTITQPTPSNTGQSHSSPFQPTQPSSSSPLMPKFDFSFPKPSAAASALAARIAGTPPKKEPEKDDEQDGQEEEDAHNDTGDGPHFEPIVKLPDKVETKTGEEDEDVLFCQRAKLYRFVDKQWKERGIGDIKILHNAGSKKCRIVMRREQVLKLCANHYISPDMTLAPMSNSEKAWTWTAMDQADPDLPPQHEFFAVRFQSAEKAAEFAKVFNQAKDICDGKEVPVPQTSESPATTLAAVSAPPISTTAASSWPSQDSQTQVVGAATKGTLVAKKEAGSWNCPVCYSHNFATDVACPCCSTPNPNAPKGGDALKPNPSATQSTPEFSFGIPASASPSTTFSFGIPSDAQPNKPSSNITFGFVPQSAAPTIPTQETGSSTAFGATQQMPKTGPLKADKKPGMWNCSACYTENEATDSVCPCCSTANPNAPKKATGVQPGIFSSALNTEQKSSFSFGLLPGAANSTSNVVSPPKFSFGSQSNGGSEFRFGFNPAFGGTANTNNSSGNQTAPSNLFSGNLGSNLPKPNIPPSGDASKPRFPSVEGDDDETDEDEEYGTDEDESSDEDEDYSLREDRYRSPLNRPENQEQVDGCDDVICLGEVLPNEELQKKAEDLMLPKHFYNYVKEGEEDTDGDSETEPARLTKPESESAGSVAPTIVTATSSMTSTTFGFGNTAGFSFADLTKSNSSGGFAFGDNKSTGWVGMGEQKPLFANTAQQDTSHDEEECPENEEANNIHFEPVVNLPDKVETVTGEEDEETLYTQRCKLYRYNKPTNEWKERGLGDIKFLKHKGTGKIRIVMRREQVLKVCANHYIRPGMTLDPNKTSDRAWTWSAMDYTDEEEPKLEIFTARFKSVEIATEFKEKFEMCQTLLLDAEPMTPCRASSMRSQELTKKAEQMKDELRYFKDKFSEPSKVDLENTITDENNLEQKPTPPVGSLTPLVAQHKESLRQSAAENTAQKSIFETPQKPKSLIPSDNKFSFSMKSQPQERTDSSKQGREHTVSTSSDDPQAEKEIHFEPIVQLPEKVDLVTGEEDEQVIFANRAKLYAFHKETKQWKERGLGDVKILQHLSTFKVRVIMRREQVFKVCLNHIIKEEYKLTFKEPNAGKTLLWTARDYSDQDIPDGEDLQFALRFKNNEIATTFKEQWTASADAAATETLLEPDPSDINTSIVKSGVASPGPIIQSPQSPESPVKQPTSTFSFANVPSPFDTNKVSSEGPVEVMGFVFGKPKETQSTTARSTAFQFDTSKFSFNFAGTSTPQGAASTPSTAFFTPPQVLPASRGGSSKNLFPAESDSVEESNLYISASNTFTPSEQSNEGQSSEPKDDTPKPAEAKAVPQFTNTMGKEYKPSPLAVSSDVSGSNSTFSQQSGKFQFKPASAEQKPTTERLVPAFQVKDPDDDDVLFVSELKPTDDQRQRAEKLLLPPTFFLYENKPTPAGYDEEVEDEKEEKVLKFIEDRNSGRLEIKTEQAVTSESSGSGDTVDAATKPSNSGSNGDGWVFGAGVQEMQQTFSSLESGSFASLASSVGSLGFQKDPSFQFPGAGQAMFQTQASSEAGDDQQDPTNYKCDAQFKPALDEPPPLIEVKTGEEGEEVLFKDRCKLYRFDKDAKAWKERGVGEIKILQNNEKKFHRVLMRRDQVFKVCTNHVINETTKPELHLGSTKSCSYFVMDYSETSPPTPEKVAMRFKNEEVCKAFMDKIAEIKSQQEPQS